MEQFEQLLTCAICLDRYRNPKLLPCQHSFCMEPCMDGLVDYVRRQVKCPECRAEHRIPYQGVQGFPTNVTLQRFLELHIEITGELPDPTSGQIMERCNVCSEKAYCTLCVHCEKKICSDCKEAHMDILRREICRINNQIRRAYHRLQDSLSIVEKNMINLQQNCGSVAEEVDEIYRRLAKALKDRTEYLRGEIERYLTTELRNLGTLKENLEQEISNIQSNCDLADKHMTDTVDWDDCELMDAKEIFLKTMEFIRNFEYEQSDYQRRVRFAMAQDPNQLVINLAGYGDLTINMPQQFTGGMLQAPAAPGLMRSKSDHRLATQFRQQEERGGMYGGFGGGGEAEPSGRVSPLMGRKFGERNANRYDSSSSSSSRYGRGGGGNDYGNEFESPYDNENRRSRYRSRFARHHDNDSDNEPTGRSVRFSDAQEPPPRKERERVFDTEDVAKGPLSGITRLSDSPRVIKRLQESETKDKKKDKPPPQLPTKPATPAQPQIGISKKAQRQVSEEDEISKIKKLNKSQEQAQAGATDGGTVTKPLADRVAVLKQKEESKTAADPSKQRKTSASSDDREPQSPTSIRPPVSGEAASSSTESDEGTVVPTTPQRKTSKTPSEVSGKTAVSRTSSVSSENPEERRDRQRARSPGKVSVDRFQNRSASSDSSTSESSAATSPVRNTGAAYTTDEVKQKLTTKTGSDSSGQTTPKSKIPSTGGTDKKEPAPTTTAAQTRAGSGRFQSRFLNRAATPTVEPTKESESSSSEETDSEEESEDESTTKSKKPEKEVDKTDIGPLLARSAQARDTSTTYKKDEPTSSYGKSRSGIGSPTTTTGGTTSSPYSSDRDSGGYSGRYGVRDSDRAGDYTPSGVGRNRTGLYGKEDSPSSYTSKYQSRTKKDDDPPSSRYGSSGYKSRFLNKSKSSAALSPEDEDTDKGSKNISGGGDDTYPSGRSRYAALKDRRSRLARSKSSHNFGGDDDDDTKDAATTTTPATSSYLSRYGTGNDISRSRSTHALKENSPERGGTEKDGAALSSWARYLKNKYGNRAKEKEGSGALSGPQTRRLSLGLPLRNSSLESSDDDQKNTPTSPTSPTTAGFGNIPRNQYLQKRRQLFKIGSRGSEPGCFTWPRGIAVGPDNTIVVADSSNHRVQVFDQNGIFVKEFGCYGNAEGEFDCLAGVAVNRIGQFIIADRYNHRIQVTDPAGRFLRAFGSQGTADGRFNYPWGITTDALGFIYVCDKENHRVQVFQSDGTFVGKFGSMGSKPGQLEHPHYIAVSNTNRVIVSDSNNHRVQIFDVNGRVLTTFGSEGSEEGQFKFPRGVAVDDQGYIFVGDSGNNRIQIFHPDGAFLRAFGCWGSGDGEFKGLEGIAVMSNGNILVCDRENHRIQVF